ncbi:chromate transporter [Falsiroseomonas sp. HW251]|uniref:chromate transporter n=1 Tax=Falsiroseomonas sp. HW251 TaxID=3390998 RepID=UPI003D322131
MSAILWQLATGFAAISLMAVGGGIAVLPEMSRLVVEVQGWMTHARFAELYALAQAAPGPNVLVVGLIGWQVAGLAGMLVATAAMTLPSGALAFGFSRLRRRLAGSARMELVEKGLVPIAVGLILASGLLLGHAAATGWLPVAMVVASSLIVWRTTVNPLWVLGAGALVGALFLSPP